MTDRAGQRVGDWRLWRHAMVRSAGFPVDGVLRLADEELAAAADRATGHGGGGREIFDALWRAHDQTRRTAIADICRDPDFLLAVTWQNAQLIDTCVEPLLAQIKDGRGRTHRFRARERIIAAYWQRYCLKTESIGFFGPVAWATIEGHGPAIAASHGPSLVDEAQVFLEGWVVERLAHTLLRERDLRPWLAPRRAPYLELSDGVVIMPNGRRQAVDQITMDILRRADGTVSAEDLAAAVTTRFPESSRDKVFALLAEFVVARWVIWRFELSAGQRLEDQLHAFLQRLGPSAPPGALAVVSTLRQRRDAVAEVCLEPSRLRPALSALDAAFAGATGGSTTRNAGLTYGGRTLAYLDCRRDLTVTIGPDLVAALAPLGLVLDSIRWMLYQVRQSFMAHVTETYRTLGRRDGVPNAAALWVACMPLFGGRLRAIVAETVAELQRRWAAILGIPEGVPAATFRLADLRADVAEAFRVPHAGWVDARWCSPDVMVATGATDAIRPRRPQLVLGEIHAAANTLDYCSMVPLHHDPADLAACVDTDYPAPRLFTALPREARPRLTARSHPVFIRDIDFHVVLMPHVPIPTRGRVCLGADVPVITEDGCLRLVMSDGTRFDAADLFSSALRAEVAQAFDLYPTGHRPRVTVDDFVIARQRWSVPVADLACVDVVDEADRFIACRRWATANTVPRQVFVKSPTEMKPFYVDFASPAYVELFASAARKVARADPGAALSVVEMLPAATDAWLLDQTGKRYATELRFVAFDQET